jgi:putative MFS transporter
LRRKQSPAFNPAVRPLLRDAFMKTVQQYLDETPFWSDGTSLTEAPMTRMQWRIWWLATAGKFFEGMVVFMTGVALPLIVLEFGLSALQKGLVGASILAGILVGATALGGLADRVGRKQMFILEMALFTVFLTLVSLAPNFPSLVVFLFGMGLALGCDYPTAHLVISESIPSSLRGRLVLSAFGFQAVGALAGTALGLLILNSRESLADWRLMFACAILPAALVVFGRFFTTQSGHWLMAQGRVAEAEAALRRLLHREPSYPQVIQLKPAHPPHSSGQKPSFFSLFRGRTQRATILASVPWFLQDLGTYGIGIFTPTILAATIGVENAHPRSLSEVIHNELMAAKGAALIDALLIVGIIAAVLLADRLGRIRLQVLGFVGCAAGLLLAAVGTRLEGSLQLVLIFAGFMLFNFMTNLGPNAMTYLIAGEVFPTSVRGLGSGFAASVGKVGAVLTSFLFPILLVKLGTGALLGGLVGACLLGAWVTARFAIETKGLNLESIPHE